MNRIVFVLTLITLPFFADVLVFDDDHEGSLDGDTSTYSEFVPEVVGQENDLYDDSNAVFVEDVKNNDSTGYILVDSNSPTEYIEDTQEDAVIVSEDKQIDEPVVVVSEEIEDDNKQELVANIPENDTGENLIIDDIHQSSTPIKVEDYNANTQNSSTKIIKYLNPKFIASSDTLPPYKTNFWKLLNEAMVKSASIILKNHDIKITKSSLDILKSSYYPNLSVSYYNEYYHGFSRSTPANIGGSTYPSVSDYRNSLSLDVQYELYHFGRDKLKEDLINQDIEILKTEVDLEKESIARDLLKNYTQALKAQENIRYKSRIIFVKNILLKNTQRLDQAGLASKLDISRLKLDIASLEKEVLNYRLQMVDALKNIYILANVNIDTKNTALEMLEPGDMVVKSFQESALAKNLKLQIDKKVKEIELLKKDYLPTLYASGSYQLYGSDSSHFFDPIKELERNNWNVGIALKWDIFNGYKTDKTIEQAKLEVQKLVEKYRLESIAFKARQERSDLLKDAIAKVLSQESVLLDETILQKELLTRLHKSGNASIMEIERVEISRLNSELSFKLGVIEQVNEHILSQLIM